MQNGSAMHRTGNRISEGRRFTIGLDLGDRWPFYCALNESGKSHFLEEKLATTPTR
jgi:hypothetical protein